MNMRIAAALLLASGLVLAGCSAGATGPSAPSSRSATRAAAPVSSPVVAPPAHPSATPAVHPVAATSLPAACATNRAAKFVRVSLSAQRVWFCARTRVVLTSAVTTGRTGAETETPKGNFTVQGLNRNTQLTLNTGQIYQVKYWIPFNAPLYGFHDASWQTFPFGSAKYRTDGSHGCVHLPLRTIAFMYRWANIGTPVHIGR